MPGAVADASTLISLAAIGRLELLHAFHGKIMVPPAVWREVVQDGHGRPGTAEVEEARRVGWIEVVVPRNTDLLTLLKRDLDDGEAEAIALAVEQRADIIFLDEAEARRTAALYRIPRAGTVGVLLRAKLTGRIPSLRAELDRLLRERGFYLSDAIYRRVLLEAGEDVLS